MQRVAAALTCVVGCTPVAERSAQMVIPREVADDDALGRLVDWAALPSFSAGEYRMQSSEDRKTGWQAPIALWSNDNRDFNNFICRGEGTDAPSPRVPYILDEPACAEGYVRGMVMARFEGSGRLARLWLTAASIRAAAPDDELVRIYVDDGAEPVIVAPLADMLGGGGHEIFAPPFGAGSRRFLAWHYPLVFARKLIVTLDHLGDDDLYFHQTSVVMHEVAGARRAASRRLPAREHAKRFLGRGVPSSARAKRHVLSLAPGERTEVMLKGPSTISSTAVAAKEMSALASVRVRVFWDRQPEPAIDVPLADLFASSTAVPTKPSLALAARQHGVALRLPMPFERHARWELVNEGTTPAALTLTHEVTDGVPGGDWGHLHVQRHVTTSTPVGTTHPLALASTRGRLVGTCVSMRGHGLTERGRAGHAFHFLEGDELGVVDGRRVLAGTGTEDYFDGAFYFEEGDAGTPFAQVWDIVPRISDAPTQGRVSACRWHVLGDTIDFRNNLDLQLEIGPGVPAVLDDYRSVTYLYLD